MSEVAIAVQGIGKCFAIDAHRVNSAHQALEEVLRSPFRKQRQADDPHDTGFWALRDISFEIAQGEVVGIIGRNGAGKSVLLKLLARVTQPTYGRIEIRGRVAPLLEVGTGFHPDLTGRENIDLNGVILGMRRREIRERVDEIVAFSGVADFLDVAIKHYSSGMRMRLAFAVAAHLDRDIFLLDEVLTVGDQEFQKKCLARLRALADQGKTVLLVSHGNEQMEKFCSRAILLDHGRFVASGPPAEMYQRYEARPAPAAMVAPAIAALAIPAPAIPATPFAAPAVRAAVPFVILSHRHSGSAVLADLLRRHAGATMLGALLSAFPEERRAAAGPARTAYRPGADGAAYLQQILAPPAGTGSAAAVGFELDYDHARADERMGAAWDYLIGRPDIRIIHVTRAHALEYLVAMILAGRTPDAIDPLDPANAYRVAPFSLSQEQCRYEFDRLMTAQTWVRQAFAGHQLLELEFQDDLCRDMVGTVERTCRFIGIDPAGIPPGSPPPRFRPLPPLAGQIVNFAELQEYFRYGPYDSCFQTVATSRSLVQRIGGLLG